MHGYIIYREPSQPGDEGFHFGVVQDILQPSSPHSRRVEKGEEVGEEEEESSLKRSKKHHHRRHGETSSSSGSRKKKKQKSRHSDKDGEQLGEYNLL